MARPKSSRSIWAIVPVKTLAVAKSRLASVLPANIRGRLLVTMLEDVLDLLLGEPAIDRVLVVTADAEIHTLAARNGASVLREAQPTGLNPALRLGVAHAAARGAGRVLIMPADVPLAAASEIGEIAACTLEEPAAVIIPSRDGKGTNALFLSPPGALDPRFGVGSFARHCKQAAARGIKLRVMRLSGLSIDIDEAADLPYLLRGDPRRYRFLNSALYEAGFVERGPIEASRS
jgi:2-phospho-L-lactate/phosphoenolpyruvate guanylyltransferase